MRIFERGILPTAGMVVLAAVLWAVSFLCSWGAFLGKISFSAALLAGLALWLQSNPRRDFRFDRKGLMVGLGGAVLLYLLFWLAKGVTTSVFSSAEGQIRAVYGHMGGTPPWITALLTLLVIGPGEEIFWRGYVQRQLASHLGGLRGVLWSTALYGAVHLWTLNPILVGAAVVAGAFWGLIYWRSGKLVPVIICHALWSLAVFALLPLS